MRDGDVHLIVVGSVAERAQAVDLPASARWPHVIDNAPSFEADNLARLVHVLSVAGAALRLADDLRSAPILLRPTIFNDLAVLPLATRLGSINVVRGPLDAPAAYGELIEAALPVRIDDVAVLVPRVSAIRTGLAVGHLVSKGQAPERPGRADQTAFLHSMTARDADTATVEDEQALEQEILGALGRLQHPASVRDLMVAIGASRHLPYKRVKGAAEALTARGELLRAKDGTAHRYHVNADCADRIAQQIAALLRAAPDLDATLRTARRYLSDPLAPEAFGRPAP
jgi:predicted transcriptional regulator